MCGHTRMCFSNLHSCIELNSDNLGYRCQLIRTNATLSSARYVPALLCDANPESYSTLLDSLNLPIHRNVCIVPFMGLYDHGKIYFIVYIRTNINTGYITGYTIWELYRF